MNRIAMLLAMNEEFAKAYRRGEQWAIKRIQAVSEIDNPTRNFPERDQHEDGQKRNWCGSCPFADGCMMCDLPYNPKMKHLAGTIASYRVVCESCDFVYGVSEASSKEDAEKNFVAIRLHVRRFPDCRSSKLTATLVSGPLAANRGQVDEG